ncbi:MAG: type II toxin-antitoxin system HicA family toxin [Candidatus Brocadiaceae bacterium]|nr:type II toxin-antitoxin system HicA family toxin [Candidatus Brocadiaceae bacterium]
MSVVPNLPYTQVVKALQRAGFVIVRQRGSHIRLQRRIRGELIKITVPAHKPIKKSTLSKIIKVSGLTLEEFKELV